MGETEDAQSAFIHVKTLKNHSQIIVRKSNLSLMSLLLGNKLLEECIPVLFPRVEEALADVGILLLDLL